MVLFIPCVQVGLTCGVGTELRLARPLRFSRGGTGASGKKKAPARNAPAWYQGIILQKEQNP